MSGGVGEFGRSGIEVVLWLALLSPLQVVLLGHSANQVIGNVALMGLMAIRVVFGGNCLAAKMK